MIGILFALYHRNERTSERDRDPRDFRRDSERDRDFRNPRDRYEKDDRDRDTRFDRDRDRDRDRLFISRRDLDERVRLINLLYKCHAKID